MKSNKCDKCYFHIPISQEQGNFVFKHKCDKKVYFHVPEIQGNIASEEFDGHEIYTDDHLIHFWKHRTICMFRHYYSIEVVMPLIISIISLIVSIVALIFSDNN